MLCVHQNVPCSAVRCVSSTSLDVRSTTGNVLPATDASHDATHVHANERQSADQSAAVFHQSSASSSAQLYGEGYYANAVILRNTF